MSLLETGLVAMRDRKRLADIAGVVMRFGLGDILARIGLAGLLPAGGGEGEGGTAAAPERLRLALEALGPTFVKLGQILSTRGDLLPPDWTGELEKLQSQVPPQPWEAIAAQVEADLGGPVEAVFAQFERQALAAGSIAQVHRATLRDGTPVVVKIRRDGLRPLVDADLRLLAHVAGLAEAQWPDLARYRPREILRHLGLAMAEELDLAAEARHCEAIAENLAGLSFVRIPRIHGQWSGERLLVQDYVDGIAPNDRAGLAAAGRDGRLLAQRGARAFLQMALVDGLFHADPHPGNLRALPGDAIAFLDFGMVGRLGGRRREQLLAFVAAIVSRDGERVAAMLVEWSGPGDIDLAALEAACDAFVARHGQPPLRLGEAVQDFVTLTRQHGLALPPDLALLFKALITADGVMRGLDPAFDAIAVAGPIVRGELERRFGPAELAGRGKRLALELAEIAGGLPGLLRLLSLRLRQGRLSAEIELKGLDRIGGDIRWAATRVAVAIVTAAFALGIAPRLMDFGPVLLGVPLPLWLALGIIAAGIAWLMKPRR